MPTTFSPLPRMLNYQAIADGIAALLFPHAEVVLYCLKTQRVLYTANNFSSRSPGDDACLVMLSLNESQETVISPTRKPTGTGRVSALSASYYAMIKGTVT